MRHGRNIWSLQKRVPWSEMVLLLVIVTCCGKVLRTCLLTLDQSAVKSVLVSSIVLNCLSLIRAHYMLSRYGSHSVETLNTCGSKVRATVHLGGRHLINLGWGRSRSNIVRMEQVGVRVGSIRVLFLNAFTATLIIRINWVSHWIENLMLLNAALIQGNIALRASFAFKLVFDWAFHHVLIELSKLSKLGNWYLCWPFCSSATNAIIWQNPKLEALSRQWTLETSSHRIFVVLGLTYVVRFVAESSCVIRDLVVVLLLHATLTILRPIWKRSLFLRKLTFLQHCQTRIELRSLSLAQLVLRVQLLVNTWLTTSWNSIKLVL